MLKNNFIAHYQLLQKNDYKRIKAFTFESDLDPDPSTWREEKYFVQCSLLFKSTRIYIVPAYKIVIFNTVSLIPVRFLCHRFLPAPFNYFQMN